MTTNARAAVLHEPEGEFLLEHVVPDDIRADEILVKIEATSICHSDIKARKVIDTPSTSKNP